VTRTGDRATPELTTARLKLRARNVDDAKALHPAFADHEAMRYWSGPPHRTLAETIADFSRPAGEWRAWSITLAGDDRAIGLVVAGEKRQGNVNEIGYMLKRSHWGHGLAAEALAALIDQLLLTEKQRRVFADTDPDNRASRRLLERLGFRLEGILRAEWETHIGVRDTALYGLLSEEWAAGKARG
jgi:ribosomal-protein-alanine N-acetyltransferase